MIRHIEYRGSRAIELSTASLSTVAPLEYGPRVLYFGLRQGSNLFLEFEKEAGQGPDGLYYLRGGHRFWHAPEHPERTYQADNDPVELELQADHGFTLRQQAEQATGLAKEVAVAIAGPRAVRVRHTLTNRGLWPVRCAPWALTVLRPGGRAVIPLLPKGEHPRDLLPQYALVPWPYTDFSRDCWRFFPSFIRLDTRRVPGPQKVGITGYPGWIGYWLDGSVFIKTVLQRPAASYPDGGCRAEVFSDPDMIELETLGPLVELPPGQSSSHEEFWGILSGLPEPSEEATVRDEWLPAVDEWMRNLPAREAVS